jgi:alpha-tubulin suppressor-like RCC1 family protein
MDILCCYGAFGLGKTIRLWIKSHNFLSITLVQAANINTGEYASFFIDNDGNLWVWGSNQFGQLGIGAAFDQHSPVLLEIR